MVVYNISLKIALAFFVGLNIYNISRNPSIEENGDSLFGFGYCFSFGGRIGNGEAFKEFCFTSISHAAKIQLKKRSPWLDDGRNQGNILYFYVG